VAEGEEILEMEPEGGKKSNLLAYIGAFFMSYLLICAIMFFLMMGKYAERTAMMQAQADSLAQVMADSADTTGILFAELDSLTQEEVDSLAALGLIPVAGQIVPLVVAVEAVPDTVIDTTLIADLGAVPEEVDSTQILIQQRRVARLVRIVDKMKAAEAASIFANLDDEFVLQLLMRMKERNAAKVLSEMPASRAARLTSMINDQASG